MKVVKIIVFLGLVIYWIGDVNNKIKGEGLWSSFIGIIVLIAFIFGAYILFFNNSGNEKELSAEENEPVSIHIKPPEIKRGTIKDQTKEYSLIPYHILRDDYRKHYWQLYNTKTKTILNNKFNDTEIQEYLLNVEKIKPSSKTIREYGWEIVDNRIFFRGSQVCDVSGQIDFLDASYIYLIQEDFGIAKINGFILDDEFSSSFFFGYIDTNGMKYWKDKDV